MLLGMAGCMRQAPKVASTPAPPPAAPPAPLVFPQNVETAPPAQPVPADAIPALARGGLAMAPEPEATPAPPPVVRKPASPRVGAAPAASPEAEVPGCYYPAATSTGGVAKPQ